VKILGRSVSVGLWLLLLLIPRTGGADEKYALWSDFVYTLRSGESLVWVVTPAFRTDEQEVNGRFTTRVSTALTWDLAPGWDLGGQFFLIGREAEVGDAAFDQRAQILLRYTLLRFHDDEIRIRGGTFYERHFRGDQVDDFNVYRQRFEMRADSWRRAPGIQQDLFFDHARGFFRTRTRVGLLWSFETKKQVTLAYQFQYTQNRLGAWTPQHAIVFRFWFGQRLSARGGR
jgi:hypothetical protein